MYLSWQSSKSLRKVVHFRRFSAFKNQNRQGKSYTTHLNLSHILYCDLSNVHFIFVKLLMTRNFQYRDFQYYW